MKFITIIQIAAIGAINLIAAEPSFARVTSFETLEITAEPIKKLKSYDIEDTLNCIESCNDNNSLYREICGGDEDCFLALARTCICLCPGVVDQWCQ